MRNRTGAKAESTKYWHHLDDGRIQCDVCPRYCKLHEGQQGLCFVRARHEDMIKLTAYGRSSGYCVDPIEKKPLYHFLPGTPVLSFGTAGCNLACKFCQNWDVSKAREAYVLADHAAPLKIASAAKAIGCHSVAYTYNDPVTFLEYVIDTALACREVGVKSVAVTAGYICDEPRADLFHYMDATNVDLKAFTEQFYHKICGGHLEPVLETLKYLKHNTSVWLEITTLLIPGENDSEKELEEMSQWVVENLGKDIPWHFSAFHPDWKMLHKQPTPLESLINARRIAMKNGVRYVYTGNIPYERGESTYCYRCEHCVIGRNGYSLVDWKLSEAGECQHCGNKIAGVFEAIPGSWGARRRPVRLSDFASDG